MDVRCDDDDDGVCVCGEVEKKKEAKIKMEGKGTRRLSPSWLHCLDGYRMEASHLLFCCFAALAFALFLAVSLVSFVLCVCACIHPTSHTLDVAKNKKKNTKHKTHDLT